MLIVSDKKFGPYGIRIPKEMSEIVRLEALPEPVLIPKGAYARSAKPTCSPPTSKTE
jgi:hypothetical protein